MTASSSNRPSYQQEFSPLVRVQYSSSTFSDGTPAGKDTSGTHGGLVGQGLQPLRFRATDLNSSL